MTIVNITVEFDERENDNNDPDYWELDCFGILKMNDIPIFETQISAYYKDPEEVIKAFAEHLAK